jgi:hypothetical protein
MLYQSAGMGLSKITREELQTLLKLLAEWGRVGLKLVMQ